jgi:hypothetical protein
VFLVSLSFSFVQFQTWIETIELLAKPTYPRHAHSEPLVVLGRSNSSKNTEHDHCDRHYHCPLGEILLDNESLCGDSNDDNEVA